MRCPFCKKDDDKVVDSRSSGDGTAIRRRRECQLCKRRYTTYETIEEGAVRVVKKDGSRESYDRSKLLSGVMMLGLGLTMLVAPESLGSPLIGAGLLALAAAATALAAWLTRDATA